ncbi:MAG: hypothetical protein ACTXOO_02820 [Sodalis sp. (in: enterobacteria)]
MDSSSSADHFFFHVMSTLAKLKRELIVKHTQAGLATTRISGCIKSRHYLLHRKCIPRIT